MEKLIPAVDRFYSVDGLQSWTHPVSNLHRGRRGFVSQIVTVARIDVEAFFGAHDVEDSKRWADSVLRIELHKNKNLVVIKLLQDNAVPNMFVNVRRLDNHEKIAVLPLGGNNHPTVNFKVADGESCNSFEYSIDQAYSLLTL